MGVANVSSGEAGFGASRRMRCPKTLEFLCTTHTERQGLQRIQNSRPLKPLGGNGVLP